MKTTTTFSLLAFACILPMGLQAQTTFLTGQTNGAMNFVDTPVDSVTTICMPYGMEHYYQYDSIPFDIDGDSLTDLVLYMDAVNEHGEYISLYARGFNGAGIALTTPGPNFPYHRAGKYAAGVPINASMTFSPPLHTVAMINSGGPGLFGSWMGPTQSYLCLRTGTGNFAWVKIGITHPTPDCYTLFLYEYAAVLTPVAVPEPVSNSEMTIFPNPTHGELFLSGNWPGTGQLNYKLVEATGKVVRNGQQTQAAQSSEKALLDMEGLADGIYFLHLQSGKQAWVQKVLKY